MLLQITAPASAARTGRRGRGTGRRRLMAHRIWRTPQKGRATDRAKPMPLPRRVAGSETPDLAAIPTLAATAHEDFCTSGNPVAVTEGDLATLLKRIV